jgi:hypothetical protein
MIFLLMLLQKELKKFNAKSVPLKWLFVKIKWIVFTVV